MVTCIRMLTIVVMRCGHQYGYNFEGEATVFAK